MAETDADDTFTSKCICYACIREEYLSAEVKTSGRLRACAYCGQTASSATIQELAERIETAFEDHYMRTPDQPDSWQERLLADRELNYVWTRDGMPVIEAIQEAAGIDEEPAADVQEILQDRHGDADSAAMGEEAEFDSDSYYTEKGPNDQSWQEEWNGFAHSLKTEARFFGGTAAEYLAEVFGGIDKLKTRDGRPLVVAIGPQTALDHLYRARVFQVEDQLEEAIGRPDRHLGSPPPSAARAGRMNAQGISVFYGATSARVAIAEVRPPIGSRVAVAKFVISRQFRLLDLTALDDAHDTGSIFDSSLKRRLERVAFLQTLGCRMARPVMPDDEALDYLPTQAVADFLATMNEPRLDGIIFPSAQTMAGHNVVLFHHAARVEPLALPASTEIETRTGYETEDGWEVAYSVHEKVPPAPTLAPADPDNELPTIFAQNPAEPAHWNDDFRQSALQIELESIAVHHVNWVEVNTTPHSVDRYRSQGREPKY